MRSVGRSVELGGREPGDTGGPMNNFPQQQKLGCVGCNLRFTTRGVGSGGTEHITIPE